MLKTDDPSWWRGSTDRAGIYRLAPFEELTGWVTGFDMPELDHASRAITERTPRAALEECLLRAVARPPCVVAFSGGRDSSALLAVATQIARREGLPDPIPVTHDFDGHDVAGETYYQELVIRHLGLENWERIRNFDGFDILGTRATQGLRRFGLVWPALSHCHTPLVDMASPGGSLVVGEGGDEVLGLQRITLLNWVRVTRPRPGRQTLRIVSEALEPHALRKRARRRELAQRNIHPWLTPELSEEFCRREAVDYTSEPLDWGQSVRRHAYRRAMTTGISNMRVMYAEDDVALHTPFLEEPFVSTLARAGGRWGWLSRTAMMRMLFADVLPDEICRRDGKARFGAVAVGEAARDFMRSWNGEGVDTDVVDVEKLREATLADQPLFGVQMLIQSAWLTTRAGSRV